MSTNYKPRPADSRNYTPTCDNLPEPTSECEFTFPMREGQDRNEAQLRVNRLQVAADAGTLKVRKVKEYRGGNLKVVASDESGDLFEIDRAHFNPEFFKVICKEQIGC